MGTPQDARIGIYVALMATLQADATLAMLIGTRIYHAEAIQGAVRPYLIVGEATELPFNTMGPSAAPKWGSDCTVQIKAVVQGPSDFPGLQILSAVKSALEGRSLSVAGFGSAWVELESAPGVLRELVSGITVRHLPAIYRVRVHEAVA